MGCGLSGLNVHNQDRFGAEDAEQVKGHELPCEVQQAEEKLLMAWGGAWTTTGYTDGHHCIQDSDTMKAEQAGASLLYGEVLPAGMAKLLDASHLNVAGAKSLIDLGSGCGRIATLAFLAYPSLEHVYAVELSPSRHALAAEAARRLAEVFPSDFQVQVSTSSRVRIAQRLKPAQKLPSGTGPSKSSTTAQLAEQRPALRVLDICCGDMWQIPSSVLKRADIVLMHTEFTAESAAPFKQTVHQMKPSARFVTYNDPTVWYGDKKSPPPFKQLEANVPESDTFLTSWSTTRGHHLFTWSRIPLHGDTFQSSKDPRNHSPDEESWAEESKRPGC